MTGASTPFGSRGGTPQCVPPLFFYALFSPRLTLLIVRQFDVFPFFIYNC